MFNIFSKHLMKLAIAALLVGGTPSILEAHTQNTADRINRIINGLEPTKSRYTRDRSIRVELPKSETRVRKGRKDYRSFYANYDYSYSFEINFVEGSATILRSQRWVLDDLGAALQSRRLAGQKFIIIGHTDAAGDRVYNQYLSERRAWAVKRYLVENFQISPHRLFAVGFGEKRLLDEDQPYSWRNRRVEIVLLDADEHVPSAQYPARDYDELYDDERYDRYR